MRLAPLPILLAVFLISCGAGTPPHVVVDPAMATLVPPDTVALVGVRVDHLMETPFYEKYVATREAPGLRGLMERTGIEPKDLWEVLAAYNGADTVVMARGKFAETGLEPKIEWEGAQRESYKGRLLIGDGNTAVTFMNATTAVIGAPVRLRSIIDQRDGASGPPAALLEMTKEIEGTNQIWAVALGGFAPADGAPPGPMANFGRVLEKIERARAMANLHSGLLLSAEAECLTPEDAETLLSALKALSGLARFGAKDQPALIAALDTVAFTQMDAKVQMQADLPPALLDELVAEIRGPAASVGASER